MNLRTKFKNVFIVTVAIFSASMLYAQTVSAREVVLQDNKLLVGFDSETGALTRIVDKTTGWTVERRPELGMSFRMLVPLPHRQDNFILGQKQRAVEVKKVSDHEIVLKWENLLSQHGGIIPITFDANVTLNDGVLTFNSKVVNNSKLMVQTVDYPYFGDFTSPTRKTPMVVRTMWYGNLGADEIYPYFNNELGYWGDVYPTKTFNSDKSLFCLIQTPREGVYVEMGNPNQPYFLQFTFEQHPGVLSSVTDQVPRVNEIGGKPVHLEFRTCHFVFVHPGTEMKLAPVVVECYRGGWQKGVDIYKKWREAWFKKPHLPDWVKKVNSWMELQVNTPVQNYAVPYDSLINYGKACVENGIGAIQLVGWNKGGQDGGNPSLSTDPGLGTWQQLHDAIQKVQAMGVKMVLFGKFPWADMTTEWYKKDLYKYEAKDPYGIPYIKRGYLYLTPLQLADINDHAFAVMDFLDPAYRAIAVQQFRKVLALGAAGFLYDEVPTHSPVKYNFAPGHGYNPPGYIYAGDEPLARELHAAADSVNPNFLFAGEGPQDWLKQYYPFSYIRVNEGTTPVARYIAPHLPIMVAVIGFDNREMLNLCLLDKYIISYEPYNFKGKLSDFPLTLAYGKKIDALRRKYKAYLWDATFRSTEGATVTTNFPYRYPDFVTGNAPGQGGGWHPFAGAYKYSVFVTPTGKRAVVVINQGPKTFTAHVNIPHAGKLVLATPEHPDAVPTDGTFQIPPRSAAVVIEQ